MSISQLLNEVQPTQLYQFEVVDYKNVPILQRRIDLSNIDKTMLFTLPNQHIHLWLWKISDISPLVKNNFAALPLEVQHQANCMVSTHRKLTFECGQLLLRNLLSTYQQTPVADLSLIKTTHGKWIWQGQYPAIEFNISHSADYLAIAFSRTYALGIDIEHQRENINLRSLAKVSFSPCEWEYWQNTPPLQQLELFYAVWSLKEAYLKAIGIGLIKPMSSYCLLSFIQNDAICSCLNICSQAINLSIVEGYSTALVAIKNHELVQLSQK
ncbi:4'-phosphopantetheinyl transferase family protein [Aquirhabdus sp.]|uniref:4'-phosphopantetheinyl transferase family protein n=1 Tax=Aquirhabdus sp. TaxID=2824160 RepID=UPI00396C94E7